MTSSVLPPPAEEKEKWFLKAITNEDLRNGSLSDAHLACGSLPACFLRYDELSNIRPCNVGDDQLTISIPRSKANQLHQGDEDKQ